MKIVGFFGKGGTGKTSIMALILREFIKRGEGEILAVDADPNECLACLLGIENTPSIADMIQDFHEQKTKSPEITGVEVFQNFFDTLLMKGEQEGYDMLIMGRGEGEGCYCAVNDLLKAVFRKTIDDDYYKYLLMDCEAGLEHIARKTSSKIHDVVIVTDASKVSLDTLKRIREVANEVKAEIENYYVVANRVRPGMEDKVKEAAESLGFTYMGAVPDDPLFQDMAYEGKTVFDLPDDAPVVQAVKKMVDKYMT